MTAREHHVANQRPDWLPPRRVSTPDGPGGIELFRTFPAVRREYGRGFRNGFIAAMVLYGIGSLMLVLAFHVLGFRP